MQIKSSSLLVLIISLFINNSGLASGWRGLLSANSLSGSEWRPDVAEAMLKYPYNGVERINLVAKKPEHKPDLLVYAKPPYQKTQKALSKKTEQLFTTEEAEQLKKDIQAGKLMHDVTNSDGGLESGESDNSFQPEKNEVCPNTDRININQWGGSKQSRENGNRSQEDINQVLAQKYAVALYGKISEIISEYEQKNGKGSFVALIGSDSDQALSIIAKGIENTADVDLDENFRDFVNNLKNDSRSSALYFVPYPKGKEFGKESAKVGVDQLATACLLLLQYEIFNPYSTEILLDGTSFGLLSGVKLNDVWTGNETQSVQAVWAKIPNVGGIAKALVILKTRRVLDKEDDRDNVLGALHMVIAREGSDSDDKLEFFASMIAKLQKTGKLDNEMIQLLIKNVSGDNSERATHIRSIYELWSKELKDNTFLNARPDLVIQGAPYAFNILDALVGFRENEKILKRDDINDLMDISLQSPQYVKPISEIITVLHKTEGLSDKAKQSLRDKEFVKIIVNIREDLKRNGRMDLPVSDLKLLVRNPDFCKSQYRRIVENFDEFNDQQVSSHIQGKLVDFRLAFRILEDGKDKLSKSERDGLRLVLLYLASAGFLDARHATQLFEKSGEVIMMLGDILQRLVKNKTYITEDEYNLLRANIKYHHDIVGIFNVLGRHNAFSLSAIMNLMNNLRYAPDILEKLQDREKKGDPLTEKIFIEEVIGGVLFDNVPRCEIF